MAGIMKSIEEEFEKHLKKRHLKQTTIDKCDVVINFCLIVSRAGTDISAALSKLVNVFKLVILVVLHPAFDPDKTIPDSNAAVNRENTFAVDFLFHEDKGLLQCQRNKDAFETFAKYLQSQKLTSYAYFKDINASPQPTDHEESLFIPSSTHSKRPTKWWRSKKYLVGFGVVAAAVVVVVVVAVLVSQLTNKPGTN
nr:uncharacterized protein LOC129440466 isoform X3 [Misgurnus anguillicaudatus]